MKLPGYYSSGQFASLANVTVRTIRYYDKNNILKPSYINENGARFYTDQDLARLQQILLLKYLGLSLDEIRDLTIGESDHHILRSSLQLQKKLVEDRIEQMELVKKAIDETVDLLNTEQQPDWSKLLGLIHLTNSENTMALQYRNASNLSARIYLHTLYSENAETWFPWVFRQCAPVSGMKVLELGCGNGSLWTENMHRIPEQITVVLSDISKGMIRDARRNIGSEDQRFSFYDFDCHSIPFEDSSFDLVIANHLLFYCKDLDQVCREVKRILKPNGRFVCSTYGKNHMKEITQLVRGFDRKIVLSDDPLYEVFGLENGAALLGKYFSHIEEKNHQDGLLVTKPEPLIEYIISCHGNQNRLLPERFNEFRQYVQEKTVNGFHITKNAGLFICT